MYSAWQVTGWSPLAQTYLTARSSQSPSGSTYGCVKYIAVSGYFAGKSDDSTFLGGGDVNFGNSLLLPNQDLNFGYQKIDVSGSYRIARAVKWFATIENLLNQSYQPAFGFPGLPFGIRTGVTLTLGGR